MSDDATEEIGRFLDSIWKDTKGQVVIAHITEGQKDTFRQLMAQWPAQRDQIVRFALSQNAKGNDTYFSPAIFKPREDCVLDERGKPTSERENVLGSWVYWADFDKQSAPEDWAVTAKERNIPEPTLILQSSVERNQHVYWNSETFMEVEEFQPANRALAISLGADGGGWDAGQLLRFPHTLNYGHGPSGKKDWFVENGEQPAEAVVIYQSDKQVSKGIFTEVVSTEEAALERIKLKDVPNIRQVLTDKPMTDDMARVFNFTQQEASDASQYKRSGSLQVLAYFGAERGYSDEQIYAILEDADTRWQKYSTGSERRKHKELLNCIARARKKHGYISAGELEFAGLFGVQPETTSTDIKVVYSYKQFMDSEIEIDWLFENMMSTSSIGIFSGDPNVGKTQLGIQMAYNIALGQDFLHWKNIKGPMKVLFLSLEMGHPELKSFLRLTDGAYPNQELVLDRNLHIFPSGVDLPLDNKQGQDFILNLMKEYQPNVLFIDSLQKATEKDLQDNVGMRAVMKFLDRIKVEHQCAIYLIHHNRKGQTGKKDHEGSLSDVFGSAFITANLDFVFGMREGEAGSDDVIVEHWKNRLGRKHAPFVIHRNQFLQYDLRGEAGLLDNVRLIAPGDSGGQNLFGGSAWT